MSAEANTYTSAIITPSSGAASSADEPTSASTATTTPAAPQPPKSLPDRQESRSSSPDSHITTQTQSTDAASINETSTPPLTVEKGRSTPTPRNPGSIVEESPTNRVQGLRSPVVEDTLSDIEEALSEISKNRQSRGSKALQDLNRRHTTSMPVTNFTGSFSVPEELNDSSSEYSIQVPLTDVFCSDADDPVDEVAYTKADIMKWTPADVSKYLQCRHIPPATCIKFEEQEVTGSILLQLEMSHLKELELGSFGKRFEVWKEIEHLVKNLKHPATKPRSGSDAAARHSAVGFIQEGHNRQRSSTVGTVLPRIRSQHNRPLSRQHMSNAQEANTHPSGGPSSLKNSISSEVSSPIAPVAGIWEQPRSPPVSPVHGGQTGSSSSKRRSTQELPSPATALNAAMSAGAAVLVAGGVENKAHQRLGSFDRSWTSGIIGGISRPSTATGMRENKGKHKMTASTGTADSTITGDSGFSESTHSPRQSVTERSYFSSGESKERKVLQKKNVHSRHSRIASAGEAVRRTSSSTLSAAIAYRKGGKDKHKRKSASFSGDLGLSDYEEAKEKGNSEKGNTIGRGISPATLVTVPFGSRSISETLKFNIEEKLSSPLSPGTGSISTGDGSTPSLTVTMESETAPDRPTKADRKKSNREKGIRSVASGSGLRQKSKKQTTAWEKGLRQITPAEAAKAGDFSGWMKKRGSSGVGAWKSRFFVLNGRRLSYFYSVSDTWERGLIDITSHKVLPAADDRLVGLHAALAAAASPTSSPRPGASPLSQSLNSPKTPNTPPTKDEKDKKKEKDQGWFTFKLVPPAPGAAKGVTFTPPRLHYFATDTRDDGKKWMAAMMKATIDRDETKPVITSYSAKTISLSKARAQRARPPDLISKDEGLGIDIGVLMADVGEEADVEDEGARNVSSNSKPEKLKGDGDSHTTIIDEDEDEEMVVVEVVEAEAEAEAEVKVKAEVEEVEEGVGKVEVEEEEAEVEAEVATEAPQKVSDIDHSTFEQPKELIQPSVGAASVEKTVPEGILQVQAIGIIG
ncbi:hypothetical protein K440DRAFT_34718 [Wilcoxina mikolae CBS 423.85]|nr:hypothetical protein K440DRAFT_34718 [Wilcoxina mikolae CBS 423.85]